MTSWGDYIGCDRTPPSWSPEVRQLWATGVSQRTFGDTVIVRTWTDDRPQPVAMPADARAVAVETMRSRSTYGAEVARYGEWLLAPPGDFRVTLTCGRWETAPGLAP